MTEKSIIIVGTAYPYRGGLSAFNERLAYEFLKEGYKVEIYTFSLQYPSFLFPGKTQYSSEPKPKDLQIIRKINSCNPFSWLKVGKEIKNKRPDILVTKYWLPFMAPCLGTIEKIVKSNNHTKTISILDNIIPHEKRIADKLFSKYFVKQTLGFVAMSKSVLNDLNLFDTQKPRLFCAHPLYDHYGEVLDKETAKKNLGLESNTKYILFFGFIRSYKGLDLLLEAMSDVRLKDMNIKLIVAGEFYAKSEPYYQQIERLGIKDRLVLKTDFIPDSKVNNYFCACDLVVQPYKSATQSGVTQIAFHFNKPMVVTDVGGLKEIVPDGKIGYVVKPDSKAIADSIVTYYSENKEKEFTANVQQEKEKYSWANMTKAIRTLALNDKKTLSNYDN